MSPLILFGPHFTRFLRTHLNLIFRTLKGSQWTYLHIKGYAYIYILQKTMYILNAFLTRNNCSNNFNKQCLIWGFLKNFYFVLL